MKSTDGAEAPTDARLAGPLSEIRVLDFAHVFAGPFCTRNLADLGASVLHVETRTRGQGEDAHRAAYAHRNKRSITLDLKSEQGNAVAARLAAVADVIVENFSSGVMRRLKLDYETLSPANPKLIYLSMSGYGHSGPRRAWTSMNMNLQAYTGLMMATGAEGDLPTSISNSWNDYIGGLHGAIAILQALAERHESGRGRNIDLSQFECSVATLGPLLMAAAATGRPPRRLGSRSDHCAPQGVYPCAGRDEWIAISVQTDEQWRVLAAVMGQPGLADDPRFATVLGRLHNHDQIDAELTHWTRERSKEDAERALRQAGVPAERMRRAEAVALSPDSGRVYRPVPGHGERTVLTATVPFAFSRSAISPIVPPSELGADTRMALRDWLGMSDAEIDELERQKALV
ncbi:MAG TPA: CoA transferase [Chloroflexota bacterium]|nr:CoA transferase [Chloroflexota bacterium]